MSVSCSDCFSDLLCGEDSGDLFGDQPEYSSTSDLDTSADAGESIAGFIEGESNYVPGIDYIERFQSQSLDASARAESVAWILKVQAYYGFQPLTAYLSVNYLDRFLYSRRLPLTDGWPLQLLSVACLSLAAKMEEPLVPSLLDLQVEGAKYIFEPRTIQRTELLVLGVLDWRLRSITPFSFISYFASKLDSTGAYAGFLISKATQIILANIQEASFLEYWPSCIAAATIVCAAHYIPSFSLLSPEHAESWCEGLSKEKIISCYELIQQIKAVDIDHRPVRKPPKVLPQLRVMTWAKVGPGHESSSSSSFYSSSSSSSSSFSSSSSSSSSCKRRKLNSSSGADDDKGSSD